MHVSPLKDSLLIELIRAATIWIIWLTRNKLCFNNATVPTLTALGLHIISLTTYWCKSNADDSYLKLTLILPMDVTPLSQAGNITILLGTDTSPRDSSSWASEDEPWLGLEGIGPVGIPPRQSRQ